jgi:hypothetical protein
VRCARRIHDESGGQQCAFTQFAFAITAQMRDGRLRLTRGDSGCASRPGRLHVVRDLSGIWQVVGDAETWGADHASREDAEEAAERHLMSCGGGKVFVFDSDGRLVKVTRVVAEDRS